MQLTLVGSHAAALPIPAPQRYWNSVLPNTPMPKSLSQLVMPDFISVGKGGVILHNPVHKEENWAYSKDSDDENARFQNDAAENAPFCVKYADIADDPAEAESLTQVEVDPNRTIFFLEKDLHPGRAMNYRLAGSGNSSTIPFLSRKTAERIPFSSSQLPEILDKLSVKPGSDEADLIKGTIQNCDSPGASDEAKQCVTSLESMIDFATSTLGSKNVLAIATEVEQGAAPMQKYTITVDGAKRLAASNIMVCHKMSYAYAVFYCHSIEKTTTYVVPLQGADGSKAKAVAACHQDTSQWYPNHYAFKELNVERGTVPICHFLKAEDVAWVTNQKPT
ncbi:BURP domain-containing protein 3-like [Pyrus ussuriensis x Pyrus communis]|uniref:BURP domain-containing protein 3-like n=1 Tax=Pyrus ussuriensis x Pyrus communis TaxID=2448454 RepID=A0A5N5HZG5_9ROSA|nr:BURP domain-containing protein 3-like [Pyrus ussuriensis x Pyrus communis]